MKPKRLAWTIIALLAALVPIGYEIGALNDGNPDTRPYTELIVTYVAMEPMLAIVGAVLGSLVLWLPVHLYRAKKKRDGTKD